MNRGFPFQRDSWCYTHMHVYQTCTHTQKHTQLRMASVLEALLSLFSQYHLPLLNDLSHLPTFPFIFLLQLLQLVPVVEEAPPQVFPCPPYQEGRPHRSSCSLCWYSCCSSCRAPSSWRSLSSSFVLFCLSLCSCCSRFSLPCLSWSISLCLSSRCFSRLSLSWQIKLLGNHL